MSQQEQTGTVGKPRRQRGIDIRVVADPPDAFDPRWIARMPGEKPIKLLLQLSRQPWQCHVNIGTPDRRLEFDWQRIGLEAGYLLWSAAGRRVAASIMLGGADADDARAIECLEQVHGLAVPPEFIRRLRDSPRPVVGMVFAGASPSVHKPIAEMSVGISSGLCARAGVHKTRPPLGGAMAKDFPPRFYQMLVVNGVVRQRLWPDARALQQAVNIQQVINTFVERLDQSPDRFDENIVFNQDKPGHRLRIEWQAQGATAGVAAMTDGKGVRHTLLLLSGKDPAADEAVIRGFEQGLPHFIRGAFDTPLIEFRTGPRPMLVDLAGVDAKGLDPAGCSTAQALAAALFRKAGAF